jgi:hypothetical protein
MLALRIFKLYAILKNTGYAVRRRVGAGIKSRRKETGKKLQGEQE